MPGAKVLVEFISLLMSCVIMEVLLENAEQNFSSNQAVSTLHRDPS